MRNFLFFTFIIAFSTTLTAQTLPSAGDLQKGGMEAISKEKPNMDAQIKNALMKDTDLQKQTMDYLMTNPKTTESLTSMITENKGSNSGIMNSILGDKNLSAAAIDYISSNPELLSKAMKLVGM